jgi:hypothetical protein
MGKTDQEIRLRIVIIKPPAGVMFALQRGKAELVSQTIATGADLSFELVVRAGSAGDGSPNFLGPFVQGPCGGRFVYVNSGTLAGQTDSCWTRRAKIHLQGITWDLIKRAAAKRSAVLEAKMAGTGRDGGPSCATVPLLEGGWKVAVS